MLTSLFTGYLRLINNPIRAPKSVQAMKEYVTRTFALPQDSSTYCELTRSPSFSTLASPPPLPSLFWLNRLQIESKASRALPRPAPLLSHLADAGDCPHVFAGEDHSNLFFFLSLCRHASTIFCLIT